MKLYELFDRKVPWKWLTSPDSGEDISTAAFVVGGKTYLVEFYASNLESFIDDRIGDFPPHIQTIILRDPVIVSVAFYLRTQKGQTWQITGTGNQYVVLSTVIEIIEKYMSKSKGLGIQYIHLNAKEPSRQKLYDRLLARLPHEKTTWYMDGEKYYLVSV